MSASVGNFYDDIISLYSPTLQIHIPLLDRIPRDDEEYGRDSDVRHGFADGRDNGVIGNCDRVGGGVAHTGHEAAFNGTGQKRLLGSVLVVRGRGSSSPMDSWKPNLLLSTFS